MPPNNPQAASGKDPHGTPDAAEFGRLRAWLAQQGVSQSEIQAAIGSAPAGRTRRQITQQLREWLRALTKT